MLDTSSTILTSAAATRSSPSSPSSPNSSSPTSSTSTPTNPPHMVGPLPTHLVTTILSHLLPPRPPIPSHYTAKPLLDRLIWLPPSPSDPDSWYSPYPASSPVESICDKLERLSHGHEVGEISYAGDGEEVFACIPILPPIGLGGSQNDVLEVIFLLEEGDGGRGWVYHAVQRIGEHVQLEWTTDPSTVSRRGYGQSIQGQNDVHYGDGYEGRGGEGRDTQEISPEEYWAGFSPPSSHSDLSPQEDESEEAYWASYDNGPSNPISGVATPSGHSDQKATTTVSIKDISSGISSSPSDGVSDNAKPDVGTKGPIPVNAIETLATLLSSIPAIATSPASPLPPAPPINDKLLARISSLLREAWSQYTQTISKDQSTHPEILEEKAMGWLRIGRSVVDDAPNSIVGSSHDDQITKAKLEVLKEMYVVLDSSPSGGVPTDGDRGTGDGFWRLIESTIKISFSPGRNNDVVEQETYWE